MTESATTAGLADAVEPVELSEPVEKAVAPPRGFAPSHPLSTRQAKILALFGIFLAVALGILVTGAGSLSSRPIDYYEDSLFQYSVASSANEAGLSATHPRLNAPLGADWRDFAIHTDLASVAQYWAISFFSDSPIQIVNIAYVLSYFWCALAFYFVATKLGARRAIAAGLAIGYPFTAYHFFRGIHHQFMSQYWTLPLLAWIAVVVAVGERGVSVSAHEAGPGGAWRAKLRTAWSSTGPQLAAAGFLCAINGAYYTVFAVFLLGLAVLIRVLRVRPALSFRHWRLPAWPLVGFALGGVTALLPSALLRAGDGVNPRTPSRMMADGDSFALRPSLLLAPVEDHRLGFFKDWADNLARSVGGGERQPMAIGLLASLGMVVAVLVLVARFRGASMSIATPARTQADTDAQARTGVPNLSTDPLLAVSALTVGFLMIALLVGVPGGLHWDISMAGFKLIRSWGRTSIVIATLALLVMALALSKVVDRLIGQRPSAGPRGPRSSADRALAAGATAVLLGSLMIWDQGPDWKVDSAQISEYRLSKRFYENLEAKLPEGTSVFYLPTVPFPEHWMGSLLYNPLEGVFYTRDLKFSSGGIAGRQSDWQENLREGPEELFAELKDAGFGAVIVDRRGFGDPQWFVDQYSSAPGVARVVEDEHRVALDISGVRDPEVRTGFDLVHQPTVSFLDGFNKAVDGYFAPSSDSNGPLQSFTHSAVIEFRNRTDQTYKACVRYELSATTDPPGGGSRTITVDGPGRAADRDAEFAAGDAERVAVLVDLPPGNTQWHLTVSGEPGFPGPGRRSSAAIRGFSMFGSFGRAPDCVVENP